MANTNVGGPAHRLLADSLKHVCEFCNGTLFQIVNTDADENTDLPSDTLAYKWENSAPTGILGNMNTLKLLCGHCGKISGKLLFGFDIVSARGANSITGTSIAVAIVGNIDKFKGMYVTVLGGTSIGISYPILSNTVADPTVFTITGTPAADAVTELMMLSDWKVF